VNSMIAGGTAGVVAKTVCNPLERVRILCQTGQSRGFVSTFTSIIQSEGVLGLWRGNFSSVIRIVPNKGILFMTNDTIKMLVGFDRHQYSVTKSVLAGSLAGVVASLSTYPLDLVRGRLSGFLGPSSRYRSIWGTIRLTVTEEGFFALYRGMVPTLLGCFPYEGIKFGVYDFLRSRIPENATNSVSTSFSLFGGAVAGTAAGVMMFPNDTVRRRLQIQGARQTANHSASETYSGALDCYMKIFKQEGIRSFYRGISATLIRVVPNAAIQFGTFELMKSYLKLRGVHAGING